MRKVAVIGSPATVPREIEHHADDDAHVLAAAVTGRADAIDSGGVRHVLPLGAQQGTPIISAREAVERIEARGKN